MKRILLLLPILFWTLISICQTTGPVTIQFSNLDSALKALGKTTASTTTGPVLSVNGKIGNVILSKADIAGINLVDNTSDLSKPVSSLTLAALNNLQIQINNKADKGTTTGSGISFPVNVNLAKDQWLITITPTNYGKIYSNGSRQGKFVIGGYKDNTVDGAGQPINFSTTDREDKVFTIAAYNILNPNGSREFATEAGWDETVETHYDNSGYIPYGDFEWHQRVYTTDGHELRNSWYVNKTTGASRRDWNANTHQYYFPRKGASDFLYGVLTEAHWDLYASQPGRIVGYWATDYNGVQVGVKEIGGVGFAEIPQFLSVKGYGHSKILMDLYIDDNDAKVNGKLTSGEVYWTNVGGRDFITRVK